MPKPIDQTPFGPKREVEQQLDGSWKVTVSPPEFLGFKPSSIVLTADQYRRYLDWQNTGELIQVCLPELSPSQREILMTGLGDEDFHEVARDDEE